MGQNLTSLIIRFVTPVVFIIKLDWSVYTCLTQLYSSVRHVYTLQSTLTSLVYNVFPCGRFLSVNRCALIKYVFV